MSDQIKTEACQNERGSFAASRGSASELEEYRDALRGCVNILRAVRYQVGLGKTQLERLTRAEQLLANSPNCDSSTEKS